MLPIDQPEHQSVPYVPDAEQFLIGAIIKKPDLFDDLPPELSASDMTVRHSRIYSAISDLVHAGMQVDVITVAEELAKQDLEELAYLADLTSSVSSYNVVAYAQLVIGCAVRRELIRAGSSISALGYQQGDAEEKIHNAGEIMSSLERTGGSEAD